MEFNVSIIADNITEPSESFFLAIDTSTLPNMVSAGYPHQVVVSIVGDGGEQTNVFVTRSMQMLQYHFTVFVCSSCKSLASIYNLPEYTHVAYIIWSIAHCVHVCSLSVYLVKYSIGSYNIL